MATPGREDFKVADSLLPGDAKGLTNKQIKYLRQGRWSPLHLAGKETAPTKMKEEALGSTSSDGILALDPQSWMGKRAQSSIPSSSSVSREYKKLKNNRKVGTRHSGMMNSEEQLSKASWSGQTHHPQILTKPPGDLHLLSIPSPLVHPKGDISHGYQNMSPHCGGSYPIAHGKKCKRSYGAVVVSLLTHTHF